MHKLCILLSCATRTQHLFFFFCFLSIYFSLCVWTDIFEKGFLDDQFNQLQQLQDESNPEFVVEVVTLFFEDAERLLNELAKAL